ncbi:SDR family oxidoreductase [Virgisporangium ochraceum]|uniref:Oxidoreductase n=1 Tax=Virgisporangium ochraceum TaxID=65505 RepID=A0A8J3ZXB2_9ACTN|nr:SDR family oxidoreductase [Virgisporangium ochraceum]GIJ72064.1 oxidoreductase [Virgisporangium ochraceum]
MELSGATVVVTGAGRGIGAALARRFAAEGAVAVVVADLDLASATAVADELGAVATPYRVDVSSEAEVAGMVSDVLDRFGHIDLFCSNAGITTGAGLDADPGVWERAWGVNVLAHIHAARAVVPAMLSRGSGYLLNTCSAAGLLTAMDDAPYAVTKHAAVAFAEWLSITYGEEGIRVSALCPQGVDTDMLRGGLEAGHRGARVTAASGRVLSAGEVADAVVDGLRAERFLILPHPEVATYEQRRANDRERWLAAMRKLGSAASDGSGAT